MKLALATTIGNQFGGVLAEAYHAAGGPDFDAVLLLPERKSLAWNIQERAIAVRRLLGLRGVAKLARYRLGNLLLTPSERALGVGADWPQSLGSKGTRFIHVDDVNSKQSVACLQEIAPDVLVSIGTPQILKPRILGVPRWGAVNLHNGRLPSYRGHFATFWEKLHDEEFGYVSVHEMVPRVDAGRLLASGRVPLRGTLSLVDVMLEKKQLGGQLLAGVLRTAAETGGMPASQVNGGHQCDASNYYGWPVLEDLRRLHWRPKRHAA